VLDAGDGEHIWSSGTLMSVKAGGEQTRDGFTLIEVSTPPRFVVPPHIHEDEEEAFYIREGQLRVSCGEQTWTAGPGDCVMMPRGIPHTCSTLGDGSARLLQITSPAGFEKFIAEGGRTCSRACCSTTTWRSRFRQDSERDAKAPQALRRDARRRGAPIGAAVRLSSCSQRPLWPTTFAFQRSSPTRERPMDLAATDGIELEFDAQGASEPILLVHSLAGQVQAP
jgi:quercetin dioxygenase-like cupin family protein